MLYRWQNYRKDELAQFIVHISQNIPTTTKFILKQNDIPAEATDYNLNTVLDNTNLWALSTDYETLHKSGLRQYLNDTPICYHTNLSASLLNCSKEIMKLKKNLNLTPTLFEFSVKQDFFPSQKANEKSVQAFKLKEKEIFSTLLKDKKPAKKRWFFGLW